MEGKNVRPFGPKYEGEKRIEEERGGTAMGAREGGRAEVLLGVQVKEWTLRRRWMA